MANLQVRDIPEELHERLRAYSKDTERTLNSAVLHAIERELELWEWDRRIANRPAADGYEVDSAKLIAEVRAERDRELSAWPGTSSTHL